MNNFITTKDANPNYLATICKITELYPIENSDRLLKTVVNGYDIVVSNDTKIGDIVVYAPVESELCDGFLSSNNLYDWGEFERNSNYEEILRLKVNIDAFKLNKEEEKAKELEKEAKLKVGFFSKNRRVRMIRLRGCPSMGFVTPVSSLVSFIPSLNSTDWESLVGTSFNYIDDIEFIKKYIPPMKCQGRVNTEGRFAKKRNNKLKRFDKLIEGKFLFHYDTQMLNTNIWKLKPDDVVTITVKVHGTSAIFANILCNRKLSFWEKIKKFFGFPVKLTEYSNIYSSRSVIKNRYINPNAQDFYSRNIWGDVNEIIKPFIPEGMTVYGEIVGFLTGSNTWIQKNHDYGCKEGEWKFMPYRITTEQPNGEKFEWNVSEVLDWTDKLMREHPEISDKLMPINILYHGRLGNLYSDISEENHWHENLLARLKSDRTLLGMEEDEPMCTYWNSAEENAKAVLEMAERTNAHKRDIKEYKAKLEAVRALKAPREGIVIRIDNDPVAEAFKLKTLRHYGKEAEQHDSGEVDIEEANE